MVDWPTRSVEECLTKLRLGSVKKLQTHDYRPSGRFPIIDQGQAVIAGWTDDDSGLIDQGLPVVVFGDHTRAFKYVDFPFVRGADGTQVLKPTPDIDPLFFFFALRGIDLPSRGYNRHFKALKEKEIGIPDTAEQVSIARILRSVEAALEIQEQEVLLWERCKCAAMRVLFTKGLRGEEQKETEIGPVPESWETPTVAESVRPFRFDRGKQIAKSAYRDTGRWPIVDQGQQAIAGYTDDPEKFINPDEPLIIFGDHTRVFKFVDFPFSLGADGTKPLLSGDGFVPKFLFHAFTSLNVPERGYNRHYTVLSEMRLPKPAVDEQRNIVAVLDAIDHKIDLHRRKRTVLDELFKALLHRLMTGEIRVADLDLSVLSLKPVAEVAA